MLDSCEMAIRERRQRDASNDVHSARDRATREGRRLGATSSMGGGEMNATTPQRTPELASN